MTNIFRKLYARSGSDSRTGHQKRKRPNKVRTFSLFAHRFSHEHTRVKTVKPKPPENFGANMGSRVCRKPMGARSQEARQTPPMPPQRQSDSRTSIAEGSRKDKVYPMTQDHSKGERILCSPYSHIHTKNKILW